MLRIAVVSGLPWTRRWVPPFSTAPIPGPYTHDQEDPASSTETSQDDVTSHPRSTPKSTN